MAVRRMPERLSVEKRNCRGLTAVEWCSGTDERIQVCVSGVRATHHSGLKQQRRTYRLSDLLSKNHRPPGSIFSGSEIHFVGDPGGQAAASWDVEWRADGGGPRCGQTQIADCDYCAGGCC